MIPTFDEEQVHAWISNLYTETQGYVNIVSKGNWAGRAFTSIDAATAYVKHLDSTETQGIYARVTTLCQIPEQGRRSGADNSREFIGFWADLDIDGPGHKTGNIPPHLTMLPDETTCRELIAVAWLPEPTEWVHSGGGMYPWWLLDTPCQIPDVSIDIADLSERWQRVIALAAEKMGHHYGSGVGDLSRVLRIPGTINRKIADDPKPCQWRIDLSASTPYTLDYLIEALHRSEKLLEKPAPVVVSAPLRRVERSGSGLLPGEDFNNRARWEDLLTDDGAQVAARKGEYIEWVRPGKERRDGMSATTGHGGGDALHVFTDAWYPLRQGENYTKFGYYAATQHGGDFREATKALAELGYGDPLPPRQTAVEWQPSLPASSTPSPTPPSMSGSSSAPPVAAAVAQRKLTYTFTDSGVADRLQARHGDDWRYVAPRKQWLRWNGSTWREDSKGAVIDLIDGLIQEAYADTSREEDDVAREKAQRAIRPMLSNSKQVGAANIFARRAQIAIEPDDLDRNRSKITCSNGVLDLETLEFGDFDRKLLATKKIGVAYDPQAQCPRWLRFLEDVLPDPSMREYLQRAVGYTLTGDANRKAIFMLHGPSHTGKSQVINALSAVFGDYAAGAKEQTFRVNESANAATPGLHKLRGARLVTASESTEGVKLDEALIKQLTGGDMIHSRALYQEEESWLPDFCIWLATNHLPRFNSDDNAIWRRVKPIYFGTVFGGDDNPEVFDIGRRLATEEGPGILNWIIEGTVKYRRDGLVEPEALVNGVTAYKNESDPVAQFIAGALTDGCLVAAPEGRIDSGQLYNAFTAWCAEEGIRFPLTKNRFGRRLSSLGYEPIRSASSRSWRGLTPGANTFIVSGRKAFE